MMKDEPLGRAGTCKPGASGLFWGVGLLVLFAGPAWTNDIVSLGEGDTFP